MSTKTEHLNKSARFWALLVLLLAGGVLINLWQRAGEVKVDRRELQSFPEQLGKWKQLGPDQRFDPATESVLRADDYLVRNYASTNGSVASFYIGYYATQRNGATYHSPLNCLPGAGWTMADGALVRVTPPGGSHSFDANRYVIQNNGEKQLMIYWYQGRGRSIASEYWGKIYTVIDSMKLRRSDGAMIRIAVPINGAFEAAESAALDLAAQAAAVMPAYVPD
jgi:EpsI family protein